jgi:hypothetical protein
VGDPISPSPLEVNVLALVEPRDYLARAVAMRGIAVYGNMSGIDRSSKIAALVYPMPSVFAPMLPYRFEHLARTHHVRILVRGIAVRDRREPLACAGAAA